MSYSTITKKSCKCGCGRMPSLGYNGYRFSCAPQELIDKIGSKKKVSDRIKANKNALKRKLYIAQNIVSCAELQRWFEDRRKEMTGKCANCNGTTNKDNDVYYRYCIAHLLPKSLFPSVKTNVDNWIELCYFNNGCHPMIDNKQLDLMEFACFDSVVKKFVAIYPFIAESEKRRIPKVLLDYIEVEK